VERLYRGVTRITSIMLLGVSIVVLHEMGLLSSEVESPAGTVSEALSRMGTAVKKKNLEHRRLKNYRRYMDLVVSRDPKLETVANHLVYRRCKQGDKACEAFHIARFVAKEIRYQPDGRGEGDYIRPWRQTYDSGSGDCEDQAILLASLLEAVGMKTLMFFSKDHVYPGVCLPEKVENAHYLEEEGTYWPVTMGDTQLYCYPLEPTIQTSRLGHPPDTCIQAVFDPKTEDRFNLVLDQECT